MFCRVTIFQHIYHTKNACEYMTSTIAALFIATLKPASFDETSNLPKQNISNIFNDHGPIPKTPRRVFLDHHQSILSDHQNVYL